jgi:hypothetical protein
MQVLTMMTSLRSSVKLEPFLCLQELQKQRVKDLGEALNWVRSSNGDPPLDPSGEFSKIDSMLPKKKGISQESHARLIEGFLDWMRNSGVIPYEQNLSWSFKKARMVPASYRTPEERSEDLDKVLNWLRQKGKKHMKYDPTEELRNINGLLPVQKNQPLEERAREMEGCLDWIRNSGVSAGDNEITKNLSKGWLCSIICAYSRTENQVSAGCIERFCFQVENPIDSTKPTTTTTVVRRIPYY